MRAPSFLVSMPAPDRRPSLEFLHGHWFDSYGSKYDVSLDEPHRRSCTVNTLRADGKVIVTHGLVRETSDGEIGFGNKFVLHQESVTETSIIWLSTTGGKDFEWQREGRHNTPPKTRSTSQCKSAHGREEEPQRKSARQPRNPEVWSPRQKEIDHELDVAGPGGSIMDASPMLKASRALLFPETFEQTFSLEEPVLSGSEDDFQCTTLHYCIFHGDLHGFDNFYSKSPDHRNHLRSLVQLLFKSLSVGHKMSSKSEASLFLGADALHIKEPMSIDLKGILSGTLGADYQGVLWELDRKVTNKSATLGVKRRILLERFAELLRQSPKDSVALVLNSRFSDAYFHDLQAFSKGSPRSARVYLILGGPCGFDANDDLDTTFAEAVIAMCVHHLGKNHVLRVSSADAATDDAAVGPHVGSSSSAVQPNTIRSVHTSASGRFITYLNSECSQISFDDAVAGAEELLTRRARLCDLVKHTGDAANRTSNSEKIWFVEVPPAESVPPPAPASQVAIDHLTSASSGEQYQCRGAKHIERSDHAQKGGTKCSVDGTSRRKQATAQEAAAQGVHRTKNETSKAMHAESDDQAHQLDRKSCADGDLRRKQIAPHEAGVHSTHKAKTETGKAKHVESDDQAHQGARKSCDPRRKQTATQEVAVHAAQKKKPETGKRRTFNWADARDEGDERDVPEKKQPGGIVSKLSASNKQTPVSDAKIATQIHKKPKAKAKQQKPKPWQGVTDMHVLDELPDHRRLSVVVLLVAILVAFVLGAYFSKKYDVFEGIWRRLSRTAHPVRRSQTYRTRAWRV